MNCQFFQRTSILAAYTPFLLCMGSLFICSPRSNAQEQVQPKSFALQANQNVAGPSAETTLEDSEFQRQSARVEAEVQARASGLANSNLSAEVQRQIIDIGKQSLQDLSAAAELYKKNQGQRKQAADAPAAIDLARKDKEQATRAAKREQEYWQGLSFENSQSESRVLQSELSELALRRKQLLENVTSRELRRVVLPNAIEEARKALESMQQSQAASAGQTDLLLQAQQNADEAKLLLTKEQFHGLELELLVYDAEASLLALQTEVLQIQEKTLQEETQLLAAALQQKQATRIYNYSRDFSILVQGRSLTNDTEGPYAEVSGWLDVTAQDPSEQESMTWLTIAREYEGLKRLNEDLKTELDRWRELRSKMQTRVEPDKREDAMPGANRWVVERLRKQKYQLPSTELLNQELKRIQGMVEKAQSLEYDLGEASWELDQRLPVAASEENIAALTGEIILEMQEYVRLYLQDLYQAGDLTQQTIDFSNEYSQYIDKQLLWTPSAPGLSSSSIQNLGSATMWLLAPSEWKQVARILWLDFFQHYLWYILMQVGLCYVVLKRRYFRKRLSELSAQASRKTCTDIKPTWLALLYSLLLSSPTPILLLFLSWRLNVAQYLGQSTEFSVAISNGFLLAIAAYLPLEFLRHVCSPKGLGIKHFDWSEKQTLQLYHHLRWLINFATPLLFILGTMIAQSESKREESLGRLAFLILLLLLATFFAFVLNPQSGVFSRYLRERSDGWLDQLKYVWFPLICLGPVFLTVLSAIGYDYTAQQLAARVDRTLWMIVLLTVGYNLAKRWLLINRRRLMMDQARKRLLKAQKRTKDAESERFQFPDDEEKEVNLDLLNVQTQSLIRSLFVTLGLVLSYFIWSDVLPALYLLDRVGLWEVTGITPDETIAISLADVLLVIPILLLTVIATRNVPGLLEIALLQHLPLTRAARYAITTLASYAIATLGLVLACTKIGLSWGSVQWLVAGLGVGLGFGLQEIFANFISGVILLFEQPIRVGDVVTIDGTTGTVSKIRIRATTILNWDRQELIVPNKELITGKLINWTLSDTTNRIVVTVGIAYGSDTQQACRIVREICQEHGGILREPGPVVTFEGFGDNTLNLVLRAYLATLDNRLSTVHELHEQIYRSFNEAGIEIAFPQLDLHLRTVPEELQKPS
ncbi:MAG: mechanosensitive ion channel domain-containing protein [Planctomycetota bacterium]